MKRSQLGIARAIGAVALILSMTGFAAFATPSGSFAQSATPAATPTTAIPGVTDTQLDCSTVKPIKVAFFGFAVANGFAQATWSGIQAAAKLQCAEAKFFDPNFDSATQIAQIQDATTSG